MNTFVTHPSVRVKGTENNYNPLMCIDPTCGNKNPHMHCPFCLKTDYYHDPVILKAHYRVKHVDKGIDFAGLKVLRCCDSCDIVGAIKGEKKFKGAHWHCYKCRNGFNRRDEALKHYKTHFRNPQTTFQIQIAQEVYQQTLSSISQEGQQAADSLTQEDVTTIHPALIEASVTSTSVEQSLLNHQNENTLTNGKASDNEVHVSVAANETVGTSEGQTIMIIHEEQLENAAATGMENATLQITNAEAVQYSQILENRIQLDKKVTELRQQNEQLEIDKSTLEQQLKTEIEQLKIQVQMQAHEITNLRKREQELVEQLSLPLNDKVQQLLNQMEIEHRDLLHNQLAQAKQTYMQQLSQDLLPLTCTETSAASDGSAVPPGVHTLVISYTPENGGNDVNTSNGDVTISSGDVHNAVADIQVTSADRHTVQLSSGSVQLTKVETDSTNFVKLNSQVERDEEMDSDLEDDPPAKRRKDA